MLFRRRHKQKPHQRLRDIFISRKGWKRPFYYMAYRLRRRPGNGRYVAVGLACGVGVSFTPFIGFHLLLGYALVRVMRGDPFAMIVGSSLANPWTIPPIFWVTYNLGSFLIGHSDTISETPMDKVELSFKTIMSEPLSLLVPMTLGGVVIGLTLGVCVFYGARPVIQRYQRHRRKRLHRRRATLNEKLKALKNRNDV